MDYNVAKEWLEKRVHTSIKSGTEDFLIMSSILENHPDYKKWKNTNVNYFKITRAPKKKSLQVYMKMENISNPRLVSWVACVQGKKKKTNSLSSAMRSAISDQIKNYAIHNPIKKCALCESYSKIEVDHYPVKFRDLKKNFLAENEEEIPAIYFYKDRYIFSNSSSFVSNWYNYHLQNAQYRYLCEKCNQITH